MQPGQGKTELYVLLRRELLERGWTRRHFAQRLGLRESTVGRWLSANPRTRVTPRPEAVTRIAQVLDYPNPTELLVAAGYLSEPTAMSFEAEPPLEEEFRMRARRFRRMMRLVPRSQQGVALMVIDVFLDGLQSLISRLGDQENDTDE